MDNVAIANVVHALDVDETHTLCGVFIDAAPDTYPTEAPVECLGCELLS